MHSIGIARKLGDIVAMKRSLQRRFRAKKIISGQKTVHKIAEEK